MPSEPQQRQAPTAPRPVPVAKVPAFPAKGAGRSKFSVLLKVGKK